MPPLPLDFKPIYDQFQTGKITFDEMVELGAEIGVKIDTYDPVTERNPAYPEGNNDSRAGFTHNIHLAKVGRQFQSKLKPMIIKCIDYSYAILKYINNKPIISKPMMYIASIPLNKIVTRMNKWALQKWDEDSFVYDDTRMQVLSENIHGYIDEFFDHQERKLQFMHKCADICLFMLKEDIYYRARAFDMMNQIPSFTLTEQERENIDTFTKGVEVVSQFDLKPVKDHPANKNMPKGLNG